MNVRLLFVLIACAALATLPFFTSCSSSGDDDDDDDTGSAACGPADAGSRLLIEGSTDPEPLIWKGDCDGVSGLPPDCHDTWVDYLAAWCILLQEDSMTRDENVQDCIDGGISLEECSEYWCNDGNLWIDLTTDQDILDEAQSAIENFPGACGYFIYPLPVSVVGAAGAVQSDVRVRFTTAPEPLIQTSGDGSQALSEYEVCTDASGHAGVTIQVPYPTRCGEADIARITADIGMDAAVYEIGFSYQ
jgi:hypothetical protein